jgi:hypothetical protein
MSKEKKHYDKVQALGCIACAKLGIQGTPAELHHIRATAGAGQKSDYRSVIPLCPYHHRQGPHGECFHAGPRAFEAEFGTEEFLLSETLKCLT